MQKVRLAATPERRVVTVIGLDGCTITVREPSNRERMEQWLHADRAAPPQPDGKRDEIAYDVALWDYRIRRAVVDWSGFVADDEQPLQFNERTFAAACAQLPALQFAAMRAANDAFAGVTEQEEKNSEPPSAAG